MRSASLRFHQGTEGRGLSGPTQGGGEWRKTPLWIAATAACAVTRSPGADLAGLRHGRFGRWTDGVDLLRAECADFAAYWEAQNDWVLATRERARRHGRAPGPLWVAMGDSTAQGIGAPEPFGGYVGQTLSQLRRSTGRPWQVLNLSVSGALVRDVLAAQVPRLDGCHAELVTCGVGANDILYSVPARLLRDIHGLLDALPRDTVVLDLPLLSGLWWVVGAMSVPYVTFINRVIGEAAAERGLRVAEVSRHFTPPWEGKFAGDNFHPSQDGYRDWASALAETIAAGPFGPAAETRQAVA
ncbi:MAG: SGNH/GDSL hydrolase family protein [Trebonia sp.]